MIESHPTPMAAKAKELAWSALNLLPQAVLIVSGDGAVLVRNAAAGDMLPAGDRVSQVLRPPEGGSPDWRTDLAAVAQEPAGIVQRNVTLAGTGSRQLLADVYLCHLHPPSGDCGDAVLVVVEDVSARSAMERQLAASQRLAGAGEAAAKFAHELNNPLDGVLRYIALAQRQVTGQAAQYLTGAREGLMRMAGSVRELLSQGRRSGVSAQRAAIKELLNEAVNAFGPRARALGVAVVPDLADSPTACADGRVFQVFCNVIKNALDAMAGGGTLTIRLRSSGGQCVIEFADTGCGMTEEQASQAFEPFYTTKPAGEGSGLGLSISREIVTQLGGSISAAGRREGGTVVTVTLPAGQALR